MTVTIIGKNSSVFSLIRPYLEKEIEMIELDSEQSLNCSLELPCSARQIFVIFSGVVSQHIQTLEKIERFHHFLGQKLSKIKDTRAILISSSAVYGEYKSIFTESDDCIPISNYGRSKLKIEKLYLNKLKRDVSIFRLGNVLGLDTVAKIFSENNECDRFLDCRRDYSTPMRTYVDAEILSHVILQYIKNYVDLPQTLNVGRIRPQAMHNAVLELGMNFKLKINNGLLKDLTLDTSRLFEIIDKAEV